MLWRLALKRRGERHTTHPRRETVVCAPTTHLNPPPTRKLQAAATMTVSDPGGARLEALAVDNGRARLVVLLLRDPHLLEGGERRQDGAADPHGVLALRRRERGQLLGQTVGDAGVHGGAAREHAVRVEIL